MSGWVTFWLTWTVVSFTLLVWWVLVHWPRGDDDE